MRMAPGVRKIALTAHVICSMGWLGAVVAFLALAIVGLKNGNTSTMRPAYLSMEIVALCVIVPLSFASLLTGLVQSLGGPWGLFRHYWVASKFAIVVVSIAILLVHMQPIHFLAQQAAEATWASAADHRLRVQLVVDSAAAIIALVAATILSIYKPRGLTQYGWRKEHE